MGIETFFVLLAIYEKLDSCMFVLQLKIVSGPIRKGLSVVMVRWTETKEPNGRVIDSLKTLSEKTYLDVALKPTLTTTVQVYPFYLFVSLIRQQFSLAWNLIVIRKRCLYEVWDCSYTSIHFEIIYNICIWNHWRIQGGAPGTRAPPLGVQILSFSCSFRQKIEK